MESAIVAFAQYRHGTIVRALEAAQSIDQCVRLVHHAIVSKIPPGEVLFATIRCAYPFAIMSQLSKLLGHEVDAMKAYMNALIDVDPEEWEDGQAQQFVDAYWRTVVTMCIKQGKYRRAYETINRASLGYRASDSKAHDDDEHMPGLQLVASRDVLWQLVHHLHRTMKNAGLISGSWMGRRHKLTKRVQTSTLHVWHKRPVAGALLVQRLGAVLPDDPSTTNQFGGQVLEIAAYFQRKKRK